MPIDSHIWGDPPSILHLEACIGQDETYTAAYKVLGKALFQTGNYVNAETILSRGLEQALAAGDKQSEKEVRVFLKKIAKEKSNG